MANIKEPGDLGAIPSPATKKYFMAKTKERFKAHFLRKEGDSIKSIAARLKVSPSTVSRWCNDIFLSKEAMKKLRAKQKWAEALGRIKSVESRKRKRLEEIERLGNQGIKEIGKLSKREFLMAGLGIYWGEGFKTREPGIVSSSPYIILFMREWFKKICSISNDRFKFRIAINILHKDRQKEIEKFWSNTLNFPSAHFQKAVIINSKQKKVFPSRRSYYGTLTLRISKGTKLRRKISGWIEGLAREAI